MAASSAQIKAIHTLKSKLHLDEETYKTNLSRYGVKSSTDDNFSRDMATDLIKSMSKIINTNSKTSPDSSTGLPSYGTGRRGYQKHLTQLQAARIEILEELLGWKGDSGEENHKRLLGFIFKQTGKQTAIQMLMNYEAGKVIVGMQRILAGSDKDLYSAINKMSNTELKKLGAPKF